MVGLVEAVTIDAVDVVVDDVVVVVVVVVTATQLPLTHWLIDPLFTHIVPSGTLAPAKHEPAKQTPA